MSTLNTHTKLDYLSSGYVREECINHNHGFEISLIQIILSFVGNIFISFDLYPPQCKQLIFDDGNQFKRERRDISLVHGDFTFGCSVKWTQGIHQLAIKSLTDSHRSDAFGITTNIEKICNAHSWYGGTIIDCNATGYVMNGNVIFSSGYHDDKSVQMSKEWECKSDDIITIQFNGNTWTVSFSINGEQQSDTMKITPNLIYSPFISSNGYSTVDTHYQILHDQSM